LKRELSELNFKKYAISQFCSSRSQVIMALANLQNRRIKDEEIIQVNNFLENNGYKSTAAS
jgi:mannitol-specific phosphotransferase system IIBC component